MIKYVHDQDYMLARKFTGDSIQMPHKDAELSSLLSRATEMGSLKLRLLNKEEQNELHALLLDDPEAFSSKQRLELLEQFMLEGMIEGEDAEPIILGLDVEDRATLCEYMEQVLASGRYLYAFYCAHEGLATERAIKIHGRLRTRAKAGDLFAAQMLAPYEDITRLEDENKDKRGLDLVMKDYDKAFPFLQDLLRFHNEFGHEKDVEGAAKQVRSHHARNRLRGRQVVYRDWSGDEHRDLTYVNAVFHEVFAFGSPYVYYFLKQAHEQGLATDEQVAKYINDDNDFFGTGVYTHEEHQRIDAIKKELDARTGEEYSEHQSRLEIAPYHIAAERDAILRKGQLRTTEMVLHGFLAFGEQKGIEKKVWIAQMISGNCPVFSFVDRLEMSKQEVYDALVYVESAHGYLPIGYTDDLSDLLTLIAYDKREKSDPPIDLETYLLQRIIRNMTVGGYYLSQNQLVSEGLEELHKVLKPKNKAALERAVKRNPIMAVYSLEWALGNEIITPEEIVQAGKEEGSAYLDNYFRILFHVHKHAREGKKGSKAHARMTQIVQDAARAVFEEHPVIAVQGTNESIVKDVYTQEEFLDLVDRALAYPADEGVVTQLFNREDVDQWKEQIVEATKKSPYLLDQVVGIKDRESKLKEWMGRNKFYAFMTQHVGKFEIDLSCFRGSDYLRYLANHPGHARHVRAHLRTHNIEELVAGVDAAMEPGGYRGHAVLSKELKKAFGYHNSAKETLRKRRAALQNERMQYKSYWTNVEKQAQESVYHARQNELSCRKSVIALKKELAVLDPSEIYSIHEIAKVERLGEEFKQDVIRALDDRPELIFVRSLFRAKWIERKPYVKAGAVAAVGANPSLLVEKTIGIGQAIIDALGRDQYLDLLREHLRSMQFDYQNYRGYFEGLEQILTEGEILLLEAENPFAHIGKKELQKDFYELTVEELATTTFFSLYEKKLRAIAARQQELNGPVLHTEWTMLNTEFMQIATRLKLLEYCHGLVRQSEQVFAIEDKRTQEGLLQAFEMLAYYQLEGGLVFNLATQSPEEVTQKAVRRLEGPLRAAFELSAEQEFETTYLSARSIRALATYYQNSCKREQLMVEAFHKFIPQVLNGTYDTWRMWGQNEDPVTMREKQSALETMKAEGLLPPEIALAQYEAWSMEETGSLDEMLEWGVTDVQSGVRETLQQAIANDHIPAEELDLNSAALEANYKNYVEPVQRWQRRINELQSRFSQVKKARKSGSAYTPTSAHEEQEYKELKRKTQEYFAQNREDMQLIEARRLLVRLRRVSLEELKEEKFALGKAKVPFKKAFALLKRQFEEEYPNFVTDIMRVQEHLLRCRQQIFGDGTVSRTKLSLTDRVDLERYVYIGEDPVPSCQNYANASSYNHGLLSYITDPNVRIVQVEDEANNMVARCVMRLLEDAEGKPQIFLEQVYSVNAHPKIIDAVLAVAKRKAEKMGVQCHTTIRSFMFDLEAEREVQTLLSKGSRSGYVYTDAGSGRRRNGEYSVQGFMQKEKTHP